VTANLKNESALTENVEVISTDSKLLVSSMGIWNVSWVMQ